MSVHATWRRPQSLGPGPGPGQATGPPYPLDFLPVGGHQAEAVEAIGELGLGDGAGAVRVDRLEHWWGGGA